MEIFILIAVVDKGETIYCKITFILLYQKITFMISLSSPKGPFYRSRTDYASHLIVCIFVFLRLYLVKDIKPFTVQFSFSSV